MQRPGLATLVAVVALGAAGIHAQTVSRTQQTSGQASGRASDQGAHMQTFVIIFRQAPPPPTAEERQQRANGIVEWAQRVNAAGHKLDPRILTPESARRGQKGSAAEIGEWPVTALLFFEARDLDQATEIAETHPALHLRASVEVRAWNPPVRPASVTPAK